MNRTKNWKQYSLGQDEALLKPYSYKLAGNIHYLRKVFHLRQDDLAKAAGISQSDISKLESGWANPKLSMLLKLSLYFNLSINDLLSDDLAPRS